MARDVKQYRVNVYETQYDLDGDVIARVRYNQNLDFWDGRNWQNGGMGRHKGITKLKDGRYVIIIGSDWQGERDYAYIVDADEALYIFHEFFVLFVPIGSQTTTSFITSETNESILIGNYYPVRGAHSMEILIIADIDTDMCQVKVKAPVSGLRR